MKRFPFALVGIGLLALASPAVLWGQSGFGGMGGFGNVQGMLGDIAQANAQRGTSFIPFASIAGSYGRELGIREELVTGRLDSTRGTGTGGISGYKSWQHTSLGLGYVGNVNYIPDKQALQHWQTNHAATLSVTHQQSDRTSYTASLMGGTAMGGFGIGSGFGAFGSVGGFQGLDFGGASSALGSVGQNGLVDAEFFNRRTYFYGASGGAEYRLSERWFVDGNGGTSMARRQGQLLGTNMSMASGTIGYNINGRSQIGLMFQQGWVSYHNGFGGVQNQTAGLNYSINFNQRTHMTLFGGAMRAHSMFVGAVAIDPEIAQLLGTSASLQVQERRFISSAFGATVSQQLQHSSLSVDASRAFSPGNGFLLAGYRDLVSLGYSVTRFRRVGVSFNAAGIRQSGQVGILATTYTGTAGGGVSFRLAGPFMFSTGAGYRVLYGVGIPRASGIFVTAGLTWSPHEFAFAF